MKNKKKILSLLACLSLLTSCNKSTPYSSSCKTTTSTSSVNPTPIEPVDYSKYLETDLNEDGTIKIKNVNDKTISRMEIPKKIDGIDVTFIDYAVFDGCDNLAYIYIPKSINNIYVAESSSLNQLSRTNAYYSSPFTKCKNLSEIKVDEENQFFYVKGNCLIKKGNDTEEDKIICGWKNVEIPENIQTIRNLAFTFNTSITSIRLNANITTIGNNAFKEMPNLNNIDLNGNTLFTVNGNILLRKSDNKILTAWKECIVPESITTLTNDDLNNTCITSVDLNKVTSIESKAFSKCDLLNEIKISESVQSISNVYNNESFFQCPNIKSIIIDENNTSFKLIDNNDENGNTIGQLLYDKNEEIIYTGWGKVKTSTNDTGIKNSRGELSNNFSITSIYFTKNIVSIQYDYFTYQMLYLDSVEFEDDSLFTAENNCIILKSFNKIIGSYGGNIATEIILPSYVETLCEKAFYGFPNLQNIVYNEGLKTINGAHASGIEQSGSGSLKIAEVKLPSTLNYLNDDTFRWKSYLNKIEVAEGNTKFYVDKNVLKDTSGKIYCGYGDLDLTDYETIPSYAFYYCYSIKSVRFSKNLKSMGSNAFSGAYLRTNKIYFDGTKDEFKTFANGTVYSYFKDFSRYKLILDNGETYSMTDLAN